MDIKNEVLVRVYVLLFAIVVPAAMFLMYKTVAIAILDGERWRGQGQDAYVREHEIEQERGNILAADGSLLATSVPYFDIYFDPFVASDKDFFANVDSLAYCLATYVDDSYTVGAFREYLLDLRDTTLNKSRHVEIKKKVAYAEKKKIEGFPLFNLGQYRGGMIAEKRSERKRPFGLLARRTIGYKRDESVPIGLEGTFDEVLRGEPGKELMVCVDRKRDLWIPTEELMSIEPRNGDDIRTTIDINIQDITESALLNAVKYHDAEWGTAVVMEVATGQIKAIANLGRIDGRNEWYETYNYAIGRAIEPGSTFKTASMMTLLEDGYITLEDSVDIQNGKATFYGADMEDASPYSSRLDTITVRQAFELSSNVGIAKLMERFYGTKNEANDNLGAAKFIEKLRSFQLDLPTGIELDGEATPYIKEAYSTKDNWSGLSLPWMAIGYELEITPLQLLTFYNAIANNGTMMKPMLVLEESRFGRQTKAYKPTVVKKQIASSKTIAQAQRLLEGVVERGTAQKLQTERYRIAGKTGTAQIGYRRNLTGTSVAGYQASFVGYFPAEKPVYSCIVVLNKPRQHGFYGSDVAGPVFRSISDKCYDSILELHRPMNKGPKPVLDERSLPSYNVGHQDDIKKVLAFSGLPWHGQPDTEMAMIRASSDSLKLEPRSIPEKKVPNVVGMGLRDALFALENRGLKVQISGVGRVIKQSAPPGTRAIGQKVWIELN